ncbi:MAG: helix-turn-helix domain-containing protein [Bacteroidota bacterium]
MHRIRSLFTPYQPSIDHGSESAVKYEESSPIDLLKPYVYCYWRLHTLQPLSQPFMYRVVSDGCVDILLEQNHPKDIFITGFSPKFLEYELGKSFDYIGIRFLPVGFPAIFDIPAHKVTNNFLPLQDICETLYTDLSRELSSPIDLDQATTIFDHLFVGAIGQRKSPIEIDKRLVEAIHAILAARGQLNLSDLDVGVSERQLRRLFEYYFGASPKVFAKVIRFQNILGAKPSMQSLRNDKIFYDEGYYDQAHFIKEFKAFYGVTPSQVFGR